MSDPMTNVQIEDVLSSIRRLVAEGDKSRQATAKPDDASEPKADRLILTDALRVAQADAAPQVEDVAELVTPAPAAFVLKNAIEEPVDLVFVDDDDDDDVADADVVTELDDASDADAPRAAFKHFDREALTRDDTLLRAMKLDAAQTQPEIVVDDVAEVEAESAYEDEMIADAMDDPQLDERLNAFLSDKAILADVGLDESVLRQMIVDIIREELQGTLGERITRNVRKLVRREIARSLAAQDID